MADSCLIVILIVNGSTTIVNSQQLRPAFRLRRRANGTFQNTITHPVLNVAIGRNQSNGKHQRFGAILTRWCRSSSIHSSIEWIFFFSNKRFKIKALWFPLRLVASSGHLVCAIGRGRGHGGQLFSNWPAIDRKRWPLAPFSRVAADAVPITFHAAWHLYRSFASFLLGKRKTKE